MRGSRELKVKDVMYDFASTAHAHISKVHLKLVLTMIVTARFSVEIIPFIVLMMSV